MVVYDDQDVIIIAPYQLKLQDAEVNPQHWVFFKCISNHPITGDPLPYARGLVEVSNGIFCRKDVSAYGGALFTAGDPNVYDGCGGGAVVMGHAFERTDDPPRICLTDYALGERYRTLYITAGESKYVGADAVLANMKLKKLTATDGAKLNAIAIGMDEYGDIPYEYESIQLNPAHNLRFCFGTNERMVLSNAGRLELPVQGSNGGLKIGDDTNLYRSAQDVLKTDDNLIVGNATLNVNPPSGNPVLNLQKNGTTKAMFGVDASDHCYISTTGSGALILTAASGVTSILGQLIVTNASGKNVSLLTYGDNAYLTAHHGQLILGSSYSVVAPAASDYYCLGAPWGSIWGDVRSIMMHALYYDYLDALDDLSLVKTYKPKTVQKRGSKEPSDVEVIDPQSMSFLTDEENMWDMGKTMGFLLGCVKALVLRTEKLEEQLKSGN